MGVASAGSSPCCAVTAPVQGQSGNGCAVFGRHSGPGLSHGLRHHPTTTSLRTLHSNSHAQLDQLQIHYEIYHKICMHNLNVIKSLYMKNVIKNGGARSYAIGQQALVVI